MAEGLALELLRPFAFVAPIPRPEDVGVDAVATVFRRNGKFLHAERSFLVQVKAASKKQIKYTRQGADWFRSLQLPLYFLNVDMDTCAANLYCPCRATRHPNFRNPEELILEFSDAPAKFDAESGLSAGLGAPILRWTPKEAQTEIFRATAYHVLSSWIDLDTTAMLSRPFGIFRQVTWETNQIPKIQDPFTLLQEPKDLPEILRGLQLAYTSVLPLAFNLNGENNDLSFAMVLLQKFMRRNGVDPDPDNIVASLMVHLAQTQQKDTNRPT